MQILGEKIEIPGLWVVLEFPKVFPNSDFFIFYVTNRPSSLPVHGINSVKKRDPF